MRLVMFRAASSGVKLQDIVYMRPDQSQRRKQLVTQYHGPNTYTGELSSCKYLRIQQLKESRNMLKMETFGQVEVIQWCLQCFNKVYFVVTQFSIHASKRVSSTLSRTLIQESIFNWKSSCQFTMIDPVLSVQRV